MNQSKKTWSEDNWDLDALNQAEKNGQFMEELIAELERDDNQKMDTPYRSPAPMIKKPQSTFGLIRPSKPMEPHFCCPPGSFQFFISWICRRPIITGTLWRCSCNKVFQWVKERRYQNIEPQTFDARWAPVKKELWAEFGGIE